MNEKEIGEIRRRVRRDRSNMTAIYGCYVNAQKEIVTEYRQSTGMMSENEAERYFGLMKRTLSGTLGKNLVDITFRTAQVADSPEHKRAKYLGRVFQDPMMGTAADMEIQENLALAKRRGKIRGLGWGITKSEKEEYRELLSTLGLGLEDRMTSKVGLLSGGQRQAVTLLMAAMAEPKLLLLDEHTAALDPKTAEKVLEITEDIVNKNHLTTLMITHNMRDAIKHGNRLIMMHEGKIIVDVSGEAKKNLTVEDLLELFNKASGKEFANDRTMLA